jgi:hypothetical protein
MSLAYDDSDPKSPGYLDRLLDAADLRRDQDRDFIHDIQRLS